MTKRDPVVADIAPSADTLTPYDKDHLVTYLRLLDASTQGADWRRRGSSWAWTLNKNPNGREPILTGPQIRELVKVALSRPTDLGLPFTEWSTAKLTAYCKQRGLLPAITDEWVRRVLRREGVTPQRLKTWKQSPDPAFEAKKRASSASMSGGPEAER